MLEIVGASVTLGNIAVLRDIQLQVAPGEICALLGPNGSGKSTLLKLASGDFQHYGGEVRLNGRVLSTYQSEDRARHLAVLPQHSDLRFAFTVEEVVAMGRMPHATGQPIDGEIVSAALEAMDVSYLRRQYYTLLSGGEKQRVQIARVMAQVWQRQDDGDRLLILDEPTSALDYLHQQLLVTQLRKMAADGCAIVMAVHDLNLAAACAERLVLLRCGSVLIQGGVEEVLDSPQVEDVFQVTFRRLRDPETGRLWLAS